MFRCILVILLLTGCAGATTAAAQVEPTVQERQCAALGWKRITLNVAGLARTVLWKAPATGWSKGALVVLHGGGGQAANFCVASASILAAQVKFTEQALAQGFAVFLPNSSDQVTDTKGQPCGKLWDDEVRDRPNLDLPFLEKLFAETIPGLRPAGSRSEIFMAGLSSGGYMSVRTVNNLAHYITAFAPVSSGDPYGTTRDCTPRPGDRANVFGANFDNETKKRVIERNSCSAPSYPNEKPWESTATSPRPPWRAFHHVRDGINDISCMHKVAQQLRTHGYPETPPFLVDGGWRIRRSHYWLEAYNQPMLDFFTRMLH